MILSLLIESGAVVCSEIIWTLQVALVEILLARTLFLHVLLVVILGYVRTIRLPVYSKLKIKNSV